MNIYHIYIHTYTYQEDHVYIQCLWFMSMVYVTVTHNAWEDTKDDHDLFMVHAFSDGCH